VGGGEGRRGEKEVEEEKGGKRGRINREKKGVVL